MADVAVRGEGFRDFVRDLKQAGGQFPKQVRAAGMRAAQAIVPPARARFARGRGKSPESGKSLKAGATQTGAYVRGGGAGFPTFYGDEFGAVRYRQFPPWRGNGQDAGYSLYPTIRERQDETLGEYVEALTEIARAAFPE